MSLSDKLILESEKIKSGNQRFGLRVKQIGRENNNMLVSGSKTIQWDEFVGGQ